MKTWTHLCSRPRRRALPPSTACPWDPWPKTGNTCQPESGTRRSAKFCDTRRWCPARWKCPRWARSSDRSGRELRDFLSRRSAAIRCRRLRRRWRRRCRRCLRRPLADWWKTWRRPCRFPGIAASQSTTGERDRSLLISGLLLKTKKIKWVSIYCKRLIVFSLYSFNIKQIWTLLCKYLLSQALMQNNLNKTVVKQNIICTWNQLKMLYFFVCFFVNTY